MLYVYIYIYTYIYSIICVCMYTQVMHTRVYAIGYLRYHNTTYYNDIQHSMFNTMLDHNMTTYDIIEHDAMYYNSSYRISECRTWH